MIKINLFALIALLAAGCGKESKPDSLVGTWELIAATSTEKGKTTSTFDPKRKMIKILNPTHFAFLNHSINTASDSTTTPFSAGGGRYTLAGNAYTEYLDYFTVKQWEGNKFDFTVTLVKDTLIQRGVEKVEKLAIDHILVETYKRVK